MYQPEIGRFFTQDRFAYKYKSLNPYQYGANNPIKYIDVNGDSLWITVNKNNRALYQNGTLTNADGTAYTGKGVKTKKDGTTKLTGFLKQTTDALGEIGKSAEGASLLSELESSNNTFSIESGTSNGFTPDSPSKGSANIPELQSASGVTTGSSGSGGVITFNPNSTQSGFNTMGNRNRPSYIGLGHELFHGRDSNQGVLYWDKNYTNPLSGAKYNAFHLGLEKSEWRASYYENLLRDQRGVPLRTHYGVTVSPSGVTPNGTRLLDSTGKPINYKVQ